MTSNKKAKHTVASNKSSVFAGLNESVVQGKLLSDRFVFFVFFPSTIMISSGTFSVSADSPRRVSCSGGISDTTLHLYYKPSSFPEFQRSPPRAHRPLDKAS